MNLTSLKCILHYLLPKEIYKKLFYIEFTSVDTSENTTANCSYIIMCLFLSFHREIMNYEDFISLKYKTISYKFVQKFALLVANVTSL